MQKLHLVGFTTDQKGLILSARRGARSGGFQLAVDEALTAAVTELSARQTDDQHPSDDGQAASGERSPRVQSALTVREIQARLRQGRTVADVARAAGVEPSWVERFAPPVFAEQDKVIQTVRNLRLRRARLGVSAAPIGDALRRNLAARGQLMTAEEFAGAWTTRQLADGRWAVRFAFRHRGADHVLRFDLDESAGVVTAADRAAGQLGYVAPGPRPKAVADAPRPPRSAADDRPTAKRPTVTTGFRPDGGTHKATSRPARERARASAAMSKAAAKRAVASERAAARRAKEKAEAVRRRERAAKAEAARKAKQQEAAEKAKAAAAAKRAAAQKKAAEERARKKAARQAEAQARRAEAALQKAEQAEKRRAARLAAAAAKKAAPTRSPARPARKPAVPAKRAAPPRTRAAAPPRPAATKAAPSRKAAAPARRPAPTARPAPAPAPPRTPPAQPAPAPSPAPAPRAAPTRAAVPQAPSPPVPAAAPPRASDDGARDAGPVDFDRWYADWQQQPVEDGQGAAPAPPADRPRRIRPLRAT